MIWTDIRNRWKQHGLRASIAIYFVSGLFFSSPLCAQTPPLDAKERAALILNSANRAFNEKQYPVAIQRYEEFLKDFGATPEAMNARYGWGLCLLEGELKGEPVAVNKQAIDYLNTAAADPKFVDRPVALYYQGLAFRRLGYESLKQVKARPNEVANLTNEANAHFTESLARFVSATAAFEARAASPVGGETGAAGPKPAPAVAAAPAAAPDAKGAAELSVDLQWAAKARCDSAEMMLRLGKAKEAFDLTLPFMAPSSAAGKSLSARSGRYHYANAAFALKDLVAAGKALSLLSPFNDPGFGNDARYLMARTHHLLGEKSEATQLYRVVLEGYEKDKVAAQALLGNAELLKFEPEKKAAAEALVAAPPEYVLRSVLYGAVLEYEQEHFAEAAARLTNFEQRFPNSPLIPEAQLRRGMCQKQQKQLPEAIASLQPVLGHADLGDRALLWTARATLASGDPNQPPQFTQQATAAINLFKQAAEKAAQNAARAPEANLRKVECLIEMGDVHLQLKQFAEAAAAFETILREKLDPTRVEECMPRLAYTFHQLKRFDDADRVGREFQVAYPQSPLLPTILFRLAENQFVRAMETDAGKPLAQSPTRKPLLDEALKRYGLLLEKYPEFEYADLARFRLGIIHMQVGDYAAAFAALATIPDANRRGDLTVVSYHAADCLLRTLPTEATNDALAAGRMIKQLGEANKLLANFVANTEQSKPAERPDALVKLGFCFHRAAEIVAAGDIRNEHLANARRAYEAAMNEFPNHAVTPTAIFERANCIALAGDVNGCMSELGRFRSDPLKQSPVAPLAFLRLSVLLRSQNRAVDAVPLLAEGRGAFEAALKADPARAEWAPLLMYHHGLATKETGKLAEAREIFNTITRDFATWPQAAEAAWRAAQCSHDEANLKLVPARTLRVKLGANPTELQQADSEIKQSLTLLQTIAQSSEALATQIAQKSKKDPVQLQLMYEAAWCRRVIAEEQIETVRRARMDELKKKWEAELKAKYEAAKLPVPQARIPVIAMKEITPQPAEAEARRNYEAIIAADDSAPIALQSRLELAEMLLARDEFDAANSLLLDALDLEPPVEMEHKLRLALGDSLLAKKEAAAALQQLLAVVAVESSPEAPEARYRAAECFLSQKEWAKAIELLIPFRDQGPLQNIPVLSERALLRLGNAYANAGNWEASRATMELFLNRYPASNWRYETRFAMGLAFQNINQLDAACAQFEIISRETAAEVAARSLLQLGRVRLLQQRWEESLKSLLATTTTYDYPEWNAAAMFDAARAHEGMKNIELAIAQLKTLLKEYPDSALAKPAQEQLTKLQSIPQPPKEGVATPPK